MKIIVVGAGIGGLRFAANAAAAGHDVSVFERAATIQAMRYPWHDDVSRTAFSRAGLDVPEGCFPKKNWSFVSPSGDIRRMYESLEESDISVPRPALNAMLAAACERAGAKLCFGINAEGAIVENGAVKGVSASSERYAADLVVDSTGVGSPLKTGLDIDIADKSEIFYAYRGFHEKNPAPEPEHTNKVYLKHLGENGISWVITDGDVVDVLIGRLGGLDITTKERALAALKADNPVIGERIVTGGGIYKIPVRYPAARMTASGYAAIGDAAYMTIPMLGSGIASSLAAADMLFAIVNGASKEGKSVQETVSKENLWRYEVEFFTRIGAEHAGVDLMKRSVLKMPDEELSWLLNSKVLTNADICLLAKGKPIFITPASALQKVVSGMRRLPLLMKVNAMLMKSHRAIRVARSIPKEYDDGKINAWAEKLKAAVIGDRVCPVGRAEG